MSWILIGEIRRVVERQQPGADGRTHQVQILAAETLGNGSVRETLFTVGTGHPEDYVPYVGRVCALEVGVFAGKTGLGLMRKDGAYFAPVEAADLTRFSAIT